MAIKALIWDLDGTIIDSFAIYTDLVSELGAELGLPAPSRQDFLDNYHGALDESIKGAFKGALKDEDLGPFLQKFLDQQSDKYLTVEEHLIEDAVDLSRRATQKGLKQVVVSNRDHIGRGHGSPRNIVANSSLKDHIHEVICGEEAAGFRKPHPKVLGDLLERWDLKPDEILVIGDQHVDAQLALNLNAKAIIACRDGAELAHAHKLDQNWRDHVTIVTSLKEVKL